MLARYFLRVALIVAAVLSMVQPARADGDLSYLNVGISSCASAGGGEAFYQSSGDVASCLAGWVQARPFYSSAEIAYFQFAESYRLYYGVNVYGTNTTQYGLGFNFYFPTGQSCPANSIGTFPTCTCAVNFTPSASSFVCEAVPPPPPPPPPPTPCSVSGTEFSSGYYDIGTDPNVGQGVPLISGCDGGCSTEYNGDSVGWRVQVGGVYHYFAKGGYYYTGANCESGSASVGVLTSVPSISCSAGQSLITDSSGFSKCYNGTSGTFVDGNSASAVAAAKTLTDTQVAAKVQAAADAVTAAGGSAADVAAAKSVAAGVDAAVTWSFSGAATADPVQAAFCAENPTSSICVDTDYGSVADSNLTDKSVNVAITPVAVGGAGSCPAPSAMVLHGQTYYFEWTTYCNFANMIKPILLAFAWLAAAGILVGGFVA